jgi:hypothetical protein
MPPLGNEDFSPARQAERERNIERYDTMFRGLQNQIEREAGQVTYGLHSIDYLGTMTRQFENRRERSMPLSEEHHREAQIQTEALQQIIENRTTLRMAQASDRRTRDPRTVYRPPGPLGSLIPDVDSWEFLKPINFSLHPAFETRRGRFLLAGDLRDINDFFVKFMRASFQLPKYYEYIHDLVEKTANNLAHYATTDENGDRREGFEDLPDLLGPSEASNLAGSSSTYHVVSTDADIAAIFPPGELRREAWEYFGRGSPPPPAAQQPVSAQPATSGRPPGLIMNMQYLNEQIAILSRPSRPYRPFRDMRASLYLRTPSMLNTLALRQASSTPTATTPPSQSEVVGSNVVGNSLVRLQPRRIRHPYRPPKRTRFEMDDFIDAIEKKKRTTREYKKRMRQEKYRMRAIMKERLEAQSHFNRPLDLVVPLLLLAFGHFVLQFRVCEILQTLLN